MSSVLSVRNVKTYFFTMEGVVKAVDDVCIEVPEGKSVGIVGESGSGKSTLAFSIARLLPKTGKVVNGQIFLKGENLLELSDQEMIRVRRKEIGFVFQDPSSFLNPVFKIGDQIAEILPSMRLKNNEEEVINILKELQVHSPEKMVNSYPHELSSGMRQRIIIATSLLSKPAILIADEPTTALDVTVQAQILQIMKRMTEKLDTSILFITHDLGVLAQICDFVYVMYAGKIMEGADIFTLFENPQHPYTQGLLRVSLSKDEEKNPVGIEGFIPSLLSPPTGCRFHPRCKKSKPICSEKEPPPLEVSPGHVASCWLYR